MSASVRVRRVLYRLAYRLLRIYWRTTRPAVAGVKAVITSGPRVLLVRHTYGPRSWDLPGGTMRRREPPLAAVRREMDEELGITNEDWRELGEVTGESDGRRDTLHCFQLELEDRALTLDYGELAAADWFALDSLPPVVGRYVREILALPRQ